MIRPISCRGCKSVLAEYNAVTGCLHAEGLPAGLRVWGVLLQCLNCGHRLRWNGDQVRRKMKEQRQRSNAVVVESTVIQIATEMVIAKTG